MSNHPRMLYKKGSDRSEQHHGVRVDTRIVIDADEEKVARQQGWHTTPAEAHAAGSKNGNGKEEQRLREELAAAKAEVAKMDPDGDGKVGGSRPKLSIKGD